MFFVPNLVLVTHMLARATMFLILRCPALNPRQIYQYIYGTRPGEAGRRGCREASVLELQTMTVTNES